MLDRIKSEPAVIAGLVQATLGLLLAFGIDLSQEQVGAIMAVTAAILALVVRANVTPLPAAANERGAINAGFSGIVALLLAIALTLWILSMLGLNVRIG